MIATTLFGPGFIVDGVIQLECAIISDRTPIFTYESCQRSLGYDAKPTSVWLHDFILHLSRFITVSVDILEELQEPSRAYLKNMEKPVIDAKMFVDICQIIASANDQGFLYASELKFARNAQTILDYFEAETLVEKIEWATGFTTFKTAVKASISQRFIADGKHYGKWIVAFPESFFAGILAMKGWHWDQLRGHLPELTQICANLTFSRLPGSELLELAGRKPKMLYNKPGKPGQYLLHENLSEIMATILSVMEASHHNWNAFNLLLDKHLEQKSAITFSAGQQNSVSHAKLGYFGENLEKAVKAGKFR